PFGPGDVGRHRLVVLQTVDVRGAPHHRVEDRAAVLGDLDPLRARVPAALAGLDGDVDRLEPGDAEVVARERGRTRVLARGSGGPQRARGHIPAHGSPDLPIAA